MKFKIGTRLAVVGENGSGKSTFIKLLCRLYDPQDGEILLNGVDIRKYSYDDYIGVFSVVFQDFKLISQRLGENVAGNDEYDRDKAVRCLEDAGFGDCTAVYISHRLSSCRFCQEILVFADGEIVQKGSHDDLVESDGLYKDLWFAQAKYYEQQKQYEEDKKYL